MTDGQAWTLSDLRSCVLGDYTTLAPDILISKKKLFMQSYSC